MSFVHLHVHSHYSLLESTIKIPDLIKRTKELGMPGVAVTDFGNMFGAVDFYLAAKSADLKPVLGAEIFYTSGSRFTKTSLKPSKRVLEADSEDRVHRLVLLCKDAQGYRNLCEIVTRAYTEGFHGKPRADWELFEKHSEGLIALTAGLKGEVPYFIATNRAERAEESVIKLQKIFKENLYLELQESGLPEHSTINRQLLEFSQKYSIKPVATSEAHYLKKEHALAQEVLMCIGAGRNLDDTRSARLNPDEFWFKDIETMQSEFSHCPEALSNTIEIFNQCGFQFKLKDDKGRQIYHLPQYKADEPIDAVVAEPKEVESPEDLLRRFSREGLEARFFEPQLKSLRESADFESKKKTYTARLESELEMIIKTGFSGYFLVVADFIKYAKSQGIPVGPGRGSGAGSIVAYALKITDIDPIPFNLLFERFINPERVSMPDFDVDFCQDRRSEVIQYVIGKYGREKVSQIITFGKLLARGVIRDVGRVLNLSYGEVDLIAKLIPEELGITLADAFEKEPRLRDLTQKDTKLAKLFEIARALEGCYRHASVHAAGVVITNRPLVDYCPLYVGKDDETVVQYDKDFAEKIGLVKFDFLGLKTLTVIDNAVKFVRESQMDLPEDKRFHLDHIDYADPKVFALISSGNTNGIFQLESSGMRDLCARVQPSHLEDITAINALYRPGPLNSGMVDDYINRKHGRTEVKYELPQLKDILEETYGVIVYQEQVMRVARVLANYSLGEADILRRAMGKKKPEEMAKQRDKFLAGCASNQIAQDTASKLFDLLAKFAEYGFNKSHSAAYGVLSFQTAYLKTYFPAQFMAALMATEMDNTEKMSQYISDAKTHGIDVLPPDVNFSAKTFAVQESNGKKAIRFGLEAIKGVGGVAVDVIIAERKERGPFESFVDFCKRVPNRKVNKKVLECLIRAGGFDQIAEQSRATLFESIESIMSYAAKIQEEADLGQVSIFDNYKGSEIKLETNLTQLFNIVPDWSDSKKLQMEKQLVGFYVSGHPLEKLGKDKVWALVKNFIHGDLAWVKQEFEVKRKTIKPDAKPAEGMDWRAARERNQWEIVTIVVVSSFREIMTKKGTKMAFVELEDAATKLEGICFSDVYEQCGVLLKQSAEECLPFVLTGHLDLTEESAKIFIRSMSLVSEFQKKKINSVVLNLDPGEVDTHRLAQLRGVLVKHRGKYPVFLEYAGAVKESAFKGRMALPKELHVNASPQLVSDINLVFGKEVVKIL